MARTLLVSTRKGLFLVERRRKRWKVADVAFLGDNVSLALHDPRSRRTWAALDHGHFGVKLQRGAGFGDWEEVATPTYPTRPPGDEDRNAAGQLIPWSCKRIWALESGHPDEGEDLLYCGTLPGGLFRSEDGGRSWALNESLWHHPDRKEWFGGGADLPGLHSICVDPRDGQRLLVAISCGGVWESVDGGLTWTCRADGMRAAYMPPERSGDPRIQDPHRVVMCAADPDVLWTQHHNGIFRSDDGARSWHEIAEAGPSTFGFAVAVHPGDPHTAWFVPAIKDEQRVPADGRVVVTRTRDGGRSFEVLAEGLPDRHAYDLVLRHALDVDEEGQVLAFGSTTGSLWVSEDQGDSWEHVSGHLPPIHAVRFA